MALVIIGGHSRSVGKTSAVASLIAATPALGWTAVKVTQFGHGICGTHGHACDCSPKDHVWALDEEKDRSGTTDSSRFLVAGAKRSLWLRTRIGHLPEALPAFRQAIAAEPNVVCESNSLVRFVRPDLYLVLLDTSFKDFKASAREYLDRADAILWVQHSVTQTAPEWPDVSLNLIAGRPIFHVSPPAYITREVVDFVCDVMQSRGSCQNR